MKCIMLVCLVCVLAACGPGEITEGTRLTYQLIGRGDVVEVANVVESRLSGAGLRFELTIGSTQTFEVMFPPTEEAVLARVERLISRRGSLEFRIVAEEAVEHEESARRTKMGEAYPGPPEGFAWVEQKPASGAQGPAEPRLLVVPAGAIELFGSADIDPVSLEAGPAWQMGSYVVQFRIVDARAKAFEEFTGRHLNRCMAIVFNEQVLSAPLIREALPSRVQIEGGFDQEEAERMLAELKRPTLPVPIELVVKTRIGPTRVK